MKIYSNFIDPNDDIFSDLKALNKPITLFYDYIPRNGEHLENPYNFIMLHEPNEFFGMHTWAFNNSNSFNGILTWNQHLIDNLDNAIPFHWSCNHYPSEYTELFNSKIFNKKKQLEVSFLCGPKDLVEGHQLRQVVHKLEDQITIPKKWFYVLDDFNWDSYKANGNGKPLNCLEQEKGKQVIFNESMFTVVIENVKYDNWFTEKISSAFTTKTVPLYWGCPNIAEWGYDERGIIRWETPEELLNVINNLTEDTYHQMEPYIKYNYEVAIRELHLKEKLTNSFTELIKENKI
jgi:hypothetical protein